MFSRRAALLLLKFTCLSTWIIISYSASEATAFKSGLPFSAAAWLEMTVNGAADCGAEPSSLNSSRL